MTSPRSYRPIALLSVLGKGLERLIAKQMSWIVIRYRILAQQKFGALPFRSSVDLTTCLTHDIETVLAKGLTTTMATIDIIGAFDAVLPGRLVLRLREQGWPTHLCNWVSSFSSKRKVRIRLDGEVGTETEISCDLPQGSPCSPILFMLFIAPLFKLDGFKSSFGYADDVAVTVISPNLDKNIHIAGTTINKAIEWGRNEGLIFSQGKSQLLHFIRRRRDKDHNPEVITIDLPIKLKRESPYFKWLGVYFDRFLSFKYHIRIQMAKALKVANALRCLGITFKGVSPPLS